MPVLDNPRHELFAQEMAQGLSAADAYRKAGYKVTTEDSAQAAGCRLQTDGAVQARIIELQERAATKIVLTRQWVLEKMAQLASEARADKQFGAAIKAVELLGRETEGQACFTQKQEIKHGEIIAEADMEGLAKHLESMGLDPDSVFSLLTARKIPEPTHDMPESTN